MASSSSFEPKLKSESIPVIEAPEASVMANGHLLIYRGLKKAKKDRGCTAKERISKMPPCVAGKRSSIYRGVTRNMSRGIGLCPQSHWEKLVLGSWVHSISPFDDKLLDIRTTRPSLEILEVSIEEELLLYRVIFLVLGICLLAVANPLSKSVVFCYGGAMAIGVILVMLMVLFQFNLKRGGQRIATMLMYLTDNVEGGETYFPQAGIGECECGGKSVKGPVKPIKGDVVLFWSMLFEMGLELSLARLKALAKFAFGMRLTQFLFCTLAFTLFELPPNGAVGTKILQFLFHSSGDLVNIRSVDEAIVIGAALTLSSSAFVLQLLAERGELPTRFGSATLGILLLQDIAVVPLLVILTVLESQAFVEGSVSIWPKLAAESLKALGGLGILSLGGNFFLRRIFEVGIIETLFTTSSKFIYSIILYPKLSIRIGNIVYMCWSVETMEVEESLQFFFKSVFYFCMIMTLLMCTRK